MSDLGIFIDESGDIGSNSDFYIVTLVFHDQSNQIDSQIQGFESELAHLGLSSQSIVHAGPIVRREEAYKDMSLAMRRKIFFKMFSFMRLCNLAHVSFSINKKEYSGQFAIKGRLANNLGRFLTENLGYFQSFEKVIVYYDNGQSLVTDLINTVFNAWLSRVDVRKINHVDYRLAQIADLVCTLELLRIKEQYGMKMSRSEEIFFESRRRLNSVFLKTLRKMEFGL